LFKTLKYVYHSTSLRQQAFLTATESDHHSVKVRLKFSGSLHEFTPHSHNNAVSTQPHAALYLNASLIAVSMSDQNSPDKDNLLKDCRTRLSLVHRFQHMAAKASDPHGLLMPGS
jgi:hypothetical protein